MKDNRTTITRVRPNSLLVWQGGSDSGEEQWTEGENRALVAGGFESPGEEEDDLWSKDGVYWFGRKAALQNVWRTVCGITCREVSDEELLELTREYFA